MKGIKPETVQEAFWCEIDGRTHLLVKARGRGWLIDSRNSTGGMPITTQQFVTVITQEFGFVPASAGKLKVSPDSLAKAEASLPSKGFRKCKRLHDS